MVYRVFVEKKPEFANEAQTLLSDLQNLLGIKGIKDVRIVNRYDADNISPELFEYAKKTVFSEPQVDKVFDNLNADNGYVFAVEYLPGQFDQRADSAAQCIQIISREKRPTIRTAKVYILAGDISSKEIEEIKKYVINPVEAREAVLEKPTTLDLKYEVPSAVKILEGFTDLDKSGLETFIKQYGLAMDIDDILFCQKYFREEKRNPTETEIRVIDTYWSDHCRHTTFNTHIDSVTFEDTEIEKTYESYLAVREKLGRTEKPVTLMDLATIAVKYLKSEGKLQRLDESEEINACSVKITVEVDGVKEPWLLMFKNETHNHPTEIEPFGGAATCIGGAIRDPMSGRSYVYGAMRVTGAADPLVPIGETMEGKLSQRKIVTTAAAGYSSYGNQIGLATGMVEEIYHPGYAAKRMEVGAVIAATPEDNVRRERPKAGDVVILLGGSTGRDGCGGATGSSKSHTVHSLETCGAEVQKGNAPEERKLQRLFRNREAAKLIKRCNDFGAGGVSVAIGELSDGLEINLNAVPKKYEGLDGTELAISESQERMAVVVAPDDCEKFLSLAESENLQARAVAVVTDNRRLVMFWNGEKTVDISRDFLDTNGTEKHADVSVVCPSEPTKNVQAGFKKNMERLAGQLNTCSHRGLVERFDSTIGAGTVLMPYGGKYQLTPIQAMVQKISVEKKHTGDCSVMSFGYNPFISEKSPYHGAYLAVVESVCKLVATGAEFKDVYLSFQEYFERLGRDPKRWGKPFAALLGAFKAQTGLGIAAIGGKDSMSGSFENIDVPPTLISFAVTTEKARNIISPEFKRAGNRVVLIKPETDASGLPTCESLMEIFGKITSFMRKGKVLSCYTPVMGGIAEGIMKMSFGNHVGFSFNPEYTDEELFDCCYGSFILEVTEDIGERVLGYTIEQGIIKRENEEIQVEELRSASENKLESVYPIHANSQGTGKMKNFEYHSKSRTAASVKCAVPKVIIPTFPGTNCEYDSAKAIRDAGGEPQIIVLNNLTPDGINRSIEKFVSELKNAQMIFIPGGFSGGDEPDGSGKFITAFFRSAAVKDEVTNLLEKRDGLICGICNGFQALIKLGLVPYGKIIDTDENSPTLTFNKIGRHQSRIVRTRIASNKSPWLGNTRVGEIYNVPISHGEGRFVISEELMKKLVANGQIATQYVDFDGDASEDISFNPNGSMYAVEGITSPDGRVFGKMGHSERTGESLYRNVPGNHNIGMFDSAIKYFR